MRIDQNINYPFLLPHIPRAWGCRSRCVGDRIRNHVFAADSENLKFNTEDVKILKNPNQICCEKERAMFIFLCLFVVSVRERAREREIKR